MPLVDAPDLEAAARQPVMPTPPTYPHRSFHRHEPVRRDDGDRRVPNMVSQMTQIGEESGSPTTACEQGCDSTNAKWMISDGAVEPARADTDGLLGRRRRRPRHRHVLPIFKLGSVSVERICRFRGGARLCVRIAAVVGVCFGSFLNVVIHRLPRMLEADWKARAPNCRQNPPSTTYNLFTPARTVCVQACPRRRRKHPVLRLPVAKGKCAHCGAPISSRYPIVEVAGALLAVAAAWHFDRPAGRRRHVPPRILLALTAIDIDTQLLPGQPDPAPACGPPDRQPLRTSPLCPAVGRIVGGGCQVILVLWLVYWAFKIVTGKEGMGYGDFKLLAALGAWLGWQMLPVIILLSSVVGALIGILLILLRGRDRNIPIPFGPYLAGAGALTVFFGTTLVRIYLG